MNEKTIAAISLREGTHGNFEEILREAAACVELAAAQGAHLAVLPETINLLQRNDNSLPGDAFAIEDWQTKTELLREAAVKARISLVLPLLVRSEAGLANCFFVLGKDGTLLGKYQKQILAPGEKLAGVGVAENSLIHWEGLALGGAICIDVYYPHKVFEPQVAQGADFFVIPSMTPAGIFLDANAVLYGVPIALAYSPWNRIVDRDGRELAAGGLRNETLRFGFGSPVLQATINFDAVTLFADRNQEKMRDVQRHYGKKVSIRFCQANCIFTLESRSADLGIREIMSQFDLISRRDYFTPDGPKSLQ